MSQAGKKLNLKIISAIPLNEDEEYLALNKAKKHFGEIDSVEYKIDPSILGGLILKTEEKILDLSVIGKLNTIKRVLEE